MVKQFTGFNEDGTPQGQDDYLRASRTQLPIMIGLTIALVVILIVIL